MRTHASVVRISSSVTLVILLAMAFTLLPGRAPIASTSAGQRRTKDQVGTKKSRLPVANYLASVPEDPADRELRKIRNSRFDNRRAEPISELPAGVEELPLNTNWAWRLSGLPSVESDAVVVGRVFASKAFLSNDRTAAYSEFTVRIDQALKSTEDPGLSAGDSIAVDREGGSVEFPSGRVQEFRIADQNMPQVGQQLVLFLKYDQSAKAFSILTGYQLHENRVIPLDDIDKFAVYRGLSEAAFLTTVRESLANAALPKKGGQLQ